LGGRWVVAANHIARALEILGLGSDERREA
jgi:hypothetical protein